VPSTVTCSGFRFQPLTTPAVVRLLESAGVDGITAIAVSHRYRFSSIAIVGGVAVESFTEAEA
jgi:hypothetical protein